MAKALHTAMLEAMCRLCGRKDSKRMFPKQKLKSVLLRCLSLDISADDDSLHPPLVCIQCERKISRWSIKRNKNISCELDINLENFEPHSSACKICPSESKESIETLFSLFDREASAAKLVVTQKNNKLFVLSLDSDGNTEKCLTFFENGEWSAKVNGRAVTYEWAFPTIPKLIESEQSVKLLIEAFNDLSICPGNPEYAIPTNLLENRPVYTHHLPYTTTIRHNACPLLTTQRPRCPQCTIYRSDLAKIHHRIQVDLSPAPKTNFRFLNKDRLTKKLNQSRIQEQNLRKRIAGLEAKMTKLFEGQAKTMEREKSRSFGKVVEEQTEEVHRVFAENTPMRILWDHQLARLKQHPQATRWHPAILRLCIALHSKSSSAYDLLRTSGFLTLPHRNTLKQYTNFTTNNPGFNKDIIRRVVNDIQLHKLKPHQKNATLSFDEVKISEGLVYSHSSGQIIGFTSMGSMNDELAAYTRACTKEKAPPMASHVLTIMVRAICHSYHSAVAYFATTGATSDQLYSVILEAVEIMELYGFKIRALVSDGASSNRSFYNMLLNSEDEHTCSFIHPTTQKRIYLFSDVPHLLKTSRNNLENSGYNNKSRNMMFRGQSITWKHIMDVYEWDMQQSTGLRMLQHLTEDHIHLTPAHRMKVKLAVQVLSSSVAKALCVKAEAQGRTDTSSTSLFIQYLDQFFDCLNVSRLNLGRKKLKPTLEPYTEVTDWRFVWLEEDFLSFLAEWESEGRLTSLSSSQREKLCLSKQTLCGLRMTAKSFISLAKDMLEEPGVDFILSEKFTQDPLEEYFSKQRGIGGRYDNPTVSQFGNNMQTLQVAGTCIRASKRANVHAENSESMIDDTPIPRRKLFKK